MSAATQVNDDPREAPRTAAIEATAVPMVVLSGVRDPVESLNGLLRRAGIAAHCTWIPAISDLADALEQRNPKLLIASGTTDDEISVAVRCRDQIAPEVPLILLRDDLNEARIATDMQMGAHDSVSLKAPARVQTVVERELRSFRLERALSTTLRSAQDYRKQLESVLRRSNDAIAQVQEGILVDANASWLELFGLQDATDFVGHPIMDSFDEGTHTALKGALIACLQGRWNDHTLKVDAALPDGSTVPLELVLALGNYEGEPCVRLIVPAQRRDEKQLASDLADAVRRDPRTGLLYRRPMFEALQARITTQVQGGARYFAFIRPDDFDRIEKDLGILASDDFLVELVGVLKTQLHPHDILGHFGGVGYLALLERGNERDVEAWSEQAIRKVSEHEFHVGGRKLRAHITIGVADVPPSAPKLEEAISAALEAAQKARQRGGNQVSAKTRTDTDARVQSYDEIWVKHIRSALMESRFRLVQQPVASLSGEESNMFDVLVRMIDSQGKEVLPSEFMPAAERNDLLKNIDRWVIGASLAFVAKRKPGCLFVRLSKDSALDPSLIAWLDSQLKAHLPDPHRICVQVTEEIGAAHPEAIGRLASALQERRMRFAFDHFGVAANSEELVENFPLDFIKIDGSLMQGLTENPQIQARVRRLVEVAHHRQILTIAERVEDANTMAVLWQLGVQYLQGNFINAPEAVTITGR